MSMEESKQRKAAIDNMKNTKKSVEEEDVISFVASFQMLLGGDATYDNLYAHPETLFDECVSGNLLQKVINSVAPGTIDDKKMQEKIDLSSLNQVGSKAIHHVNANLNQVLTGAKKMKIKMTNIGTNDIIEKNTTIVLGMIWQIVRAGLVQDVSLLSHPELIRLLLPDENLAALIALEPEALLMRWVNHHLMRAGVETRVNNFAKDMKDSTVYATILERVAPRKINKADLDAAMADDDHMVRAQGVLDQCKVIECETFVRPLNIANGHSKFNMALVAGLFNSHIGIHLPTEDELDDLFADLDHKNENVAALTKQLTESVAHAKVLDEERARLVGVEQALEKKAEQQSVAFEQTKVELLEAAKEEREALVVSHTRAVEEATAREEHLTQALAAETEAKEAERAAKEAERAAKLDTAEAGEAAKEAALALHEAERKAKQIETAAKAAVTEQLHQTRDELEKTETTLVETKTELTSERKSKEAEIAAKEALQEELAQTKAELKDRNEKLDEETTHTSKVTEEMSSMASAITTGLGKDCEIPEEGTDTEKLMKLIDQLLKTNKETKKKMHEALSAYAAEKNEKNVILDKIIKQTSLSADDKLRQYEAELKEKEDKKKKGFFSKKKDDKK